MPDCVVKAERYFAEPTKAGAPRHDDRGSSERDFARVLHSGAFRRLQGKSQVVHTGHADYFRTRLTHTLEVSQIGRALAARAGLTDGNLVDAACLIHDLGHPPFGHNGEDALKVWMKDSGSFEANAQSFRIVAALEVKFPPSETCDRVIGLNLSRRTLLASFKYPWSRDPGDPTRSEKFGYYEDEEEADIAKWVLGGPTARTKDVVAVLMDLADDIAYSVHDLEDGARAGLIPLNALKLDREERAALVAYWVAKKAPRFDGRESELTAALDRLLDASGLFDWCSHRYDRTNEQRGRAKEMTSGLIDRFVRAVTFARTPAQQEADISLSEATEFEIWALKAMTWRYVIDSQALQTLQYRERRIITELAETLSDEDGWSLLPEDKRDAMNRAASDERRARIVCDFVAGMTDRFAQSFHARLFGYQAQAVTDLL